MPDIKHNISTNQKTKKSPTPLKKKKSQQNLQQFFYIKYNERFTHKKNLLDLTDKKIERKTCRKIKIFCKAETRQQMQTKNRK